MLESEEHLVAWVSVEDKRTIMAHLDMEGDAIEFEELREASARTHEVLTRVAQYSQLIREVQMICVDPQQIIDPLRRITDLQTKQFLPSQCDHTEFERQILTLTNERNDARMSPAAPGTDEDLQQELADMTQDAQQSAEEVRSLRMQLANALMLAARMGPVAHQTPEAPQTPEARGQKFPDSPHFSGSDGTQLRGWIAQLQMVIQHKPASFPDEQWKMRYAFNR
jgi:hypothetical protein